ncbi:sodium:calcium antiporter [Methyloprofundus sedimenti]|uniref:Sodium:calcium antiporter n=1 Tax=Methyloprofundus sedimenti TaxID=1420851 RepID=A0A1V8M3E9_9GAMM|nr:calcium/sodium antiporter [Methyloprofundus sedimenti]OQK16084.1 sodium:calcium antiporter [Methyloprofundus sedimenti]
MDNLTLVLFVLGLVFLVGGAEALVRGSSRLAATFGVSPLVVGLTVVAFGTSAPELAVSVRSALIGQAGANIAIGNVVGSNIANVLLILGIAALVAPLVVSQRLIRRDAPFMIGVSILLYIFALDGSINRVEGLTLFIMVLTYTGHVIRSSRRENAVIQAEYAAEFRQTKNTLFKDIILIVLGLVLLVLGSQWLVDSAVSIAHALAVSDLVIGLTVVAVGTSLPELATSIVASFRGETDIAVGNVVGSNLFNILCVIGLSALVAPDGVLVATEALAFDIPAMIAVAMLCLPVFFTGYLISRWEGLVFLGYYLVYMLWLVLNSAYREYLATGLHAIIPLTILTLVVLSLRQLRIKH